MRLKPDGTRWRTGGEVKGKLANAVGSQYSHNTSERGASSITTADAHTSAASSRLNWRPRRFKWTRPFRRKTKSGFCACAMTFQTHSTRFFYFFFPSSSPTSLMAYVFYSSCGASSRARFSSISPLYKTSRISAARTEHNIHTLIPNCRYRSRITK